MRSTVLIVAIFLIAIVLYLQSGGRRDAAGDDPSSEFHCEGKTQCTQMSSCDEAKFYQRNCPDVDLEDDDGVPCKSQWCQTGD